MDSLEPLLTTEELANYLKVDVVTIRRLVSRGELAAYRIGGEYRFAQSDVLAYLQRQHIPTQAAAEPEEAARAEIVPLEAAQAVLAHASQPAPQLQPEALTKRAREALQHAADEARRLGRPTIGSDLLLLGLIATSEGTSGKLFQALGLSLEQARQAVERSSGGGAGPLEAEPELEAGRVLELAVQAMQQHRHKALGTEHLLLGVVREQDGAGARVLQSLGIALDQISKAIMRVIWRERRPG